MNEIDRVIARLKRQYSAYEQERNQADEDGVIDVSLACDLADSVPFLIEIIKNNNEEIQWLYGKLGQISGIIEISREQSKRF